MLTKLFQMYRRYRLERQLKEDWLHSYASDEGRQRLRKEYGLG